MEAPQSTFMDNHVLYMEPIKKVNLAEKFALIHEYRSPKVAGELNGQHVKLVKMKGEFIWHHHELEDEMFLVIKGKFLMELRTGNIEVNEGEFIIIPRGVEHRPVAAAEVEILLFEPAGTLNTGNIRNDYTRDTEVI
jgi:mannose-6-phosphate isomerase-like protein (cupin superfamily)